MGRVLMTGGGGGADLDMITAAADDVLSGKVIVDKDGNPLSGTMKNIGAYDSVVSIGVDGGNLYLRMNNGAHITNTVSGYPELICSYDSALNAMGISSMAGGTYTPSTSQQTISCSGKKMTSNVIIKGDGNLVAGNILNGKSIFGVAGNVRKFASRSGQVTSDSDGYVTLSPGFYIQSWMFMAENSPHDLSTSCPWSPTNQSVILPNYTLVSPTRSGTTFKVKVTTQNKNYNYYVTGYY